MHHVQLARFSKTRVRVHSSMASVRITAKLEGTKGKVWFFLWKEGQAQGFPRFDKGSPVASLSVSAASPSATFAAVQPGIYAVSSFHDEKETGKPETNLIGMPKCALGVSNNVTGGFGPPPFEKASFTVASAHVELTIELKKIF